MRLIDADALKEKAFFHEIDNVSYVEEEDIDNAPTVDAVEVVRCKECKNWDTEWKPVFGGVENETHYCPMLDNTTEENFFCSYGERR